MPKALRPKGSTNCDCRGGEEIIATKMRLHLDTEVDTLYSDFLSEAEFKIVQEQLDKVEHIGTIRAL